MKAEVTDAEKVYAALQALIDAADDAWDDEAFREDWGPQHMLWGEISVWADEMMIRMRRDGHVTADE